MKSKISLISVSSLLAVSLVGNIFVTSLFLKSERTVNELNAKIDELTTAQDKKEEANEENVLNEDSKVIPDSNFDYDSEGKMNLKDDKVYYQKVVEKEDYHYTTDEYKFSGKNNANFEMSVYLDRENSLIVNYTDDNVNVSNQKITGFKSEIEAVYIINVGQNTEVDNYRIVVLMKDGTVEYVKNSDIRNGNYVSAGKLVEFDDIVRVENSSVNTGRGGTTGIGLVRSNGDKYFISILPR